MRWAALLLGIAATVNALGPGRPEKSRWDTFFMLAVDLQVLMGLVLYFGLSPFTTSGMNDPRMALGEPVLRFWTFLHISLMFGAALMVRVGRILAMNASTPDARRRRRGIAFAVALAIMAAGIPWPGTAAARPLFRV
jgi:hypothetical protein